MISLLMLPLSFFTGGLSENGTPAAVFIAVMLTAVAWFSGRKPSLLRVLSFFCSAGGYLFMVTRPAERNKVHAFSLQLLRKGFGQAMEMYKSFVALLICFAVLFVLSIIFKTARSATILSFVFFAGSLVSNYMMVFAAFYNGRSAFFSIVLLIMANGVLICALRSTPCRIQLACLLAVLLTVTVFPVCSGIDDIYVTNKRIANNRIELYEQKERGEEQIVLPVIWPKTKYCALFDIKYLDTESAQDYPNADMAQYYGVSSIIGE